ncbi:MAG TPA: class I SAM-dependent DNA methyltransferase [Ottowia sp.]|nr:class I SAM-dependent DNA methyltransferase [Ottowia sp.]
MKPDDDARAFIARWQGVAASELATAQSFVIELCALLGVERPHPSAAQDYMFERPVTFQHGDGSTSSGRIDCYRRGHFVLEAKKLKAPGHTRGFDDGMLRARGQAEGYARALPAAEGRPPFVLVVDVGNLIEVYAEFSRSGGTYTPFPDPRSHRIALADLAEPRIRQRLRLIWSEPDALDPARISAQVTRAVSDQLARLARSLEDSGHAPHAVAAYLSRCLFSMFAEDVELLPAGSFLGLLQTHQRQPATLRQMLRILWADMDRGGFSAALAGQVLHFNGKLFKGAHEDGYSLPLTPAQVELLIAAARANWREVEPAIFGTLLERALDPAERHALGAHYTPRAYVERLVLPTVIEPLRADWTSAQAAALVLAHEAASLQGRAADARLAEARAEIRRFHHQLCTTRVLDPACGSANFLYVTLEHLKRLEGEVLNQLHELGHAQDQLGFEGETVTLQQLLGIELNPRAAALAELVLWIGWLQWHIRARGNAAVAEPVVHDYRNIDCRDAVLAWDAQEPAHDAAGQPRTRWDGVTYKRHPVTGEPVPDEAAQVPQWRYLGARPAAWPRADFIVGNPPFIGAASMRAALGDGYVEALRAAWPEVPESSDFVMYWWQRAARQVAAGQARRMGLITTNSLRQTFNRRVVQAALAAGTHLEMAIADHPWVDFAGNAAVRIAMSVLAPGEGEGELLTVTDERPGEFGEMQVTVKAQRGLIHADLSIGANVAATQALQSNTGLTFRGVTLMGTGFWVEPDDPLIALEPQIVKPLRNGRDLTDKVRGVYAIDFYGHTLEAAREVFPNAYQRVLIGVKPERDQSQRASYREKWWLFAEARPDMRRALESLERFVVTPMTAKHRTFQYLPAGVLPDQGLIVFAVSDSYVLGVLSSQLHIDWALATGSRLGVGNDPRYNNSRCFETFPFPDDDTGLTSELRQRIARLAEQIDQHRKRVLAPAAGHAGLTLTGLYNVLAALREGRALTAKEQAIHTQGLVGVLRELHDELDAAVRAAYGLPASATTDDVLAELVRLNARRAAEEAQGQVRWLRPAFQQAPAAPADQPLPGLAPADAPEAVAEGTPDAAPAAAHRQPWPTALPAQIRLLADTLAASATPLSLEQLAARFQGKGRWRERLPTLLDTLAALGRVQPQADGRWAALR